MRSITRTCERVVFIRGWMSVWLTVVSLAVLATVFVPAVQAMQRSGPELLTYDELVQLYEQEIPSAPLREKLNRLLTTPFINNEASNLGVKPLKPYSPKLGRFLRVVFWNIERGLEFEAIKLALSDAAKFSSLLDKSKYPRGSTRRMRVLRQVELLREADVIILNEVDWGMKRTEYRHVAEELASALGMNYAFGVEFVEIDPLDLGIEQFEDVPAEDRTELIEHIKVDRTRYKGLHGTAILSRYALQNVRLVPFVHQGYDWYTGELKGVTRLEAGKRAVGRRVFLEKVLREVRRGGRMMLLADIVDPDIPGGKATIVATHLEARTKPENRVKQLEELLDYIKDIDHPVILAGDMNTSTKDTTPTSIGREIKKRFGSGQFWMRQGLKYATGVGLMLDVVLGGVGFGRAQADPTVRHIRVVATNPEAKFFDVLERFRFSDGGAFDFRGDSKRSANGRRGTLANSNERGRKGFVTTYEVTRTIGPVGRFKLDWIFVKPPTLTSPRDRNQSYRFAPHFGRTYRSLNYSLADRISDHSPISVDLPLTEPRIR